MFQRGQRIVIKESSASSKAHPNVGDVGYMGSAFMFYKDRFILIDAEFFRYSGDETQRKKSEHKSFIIDLGMSYALKKKLITQGLTRQYLADTAFAVNLNPVFTEVSFSPSDRPSVLSMWPSIFERLLANPKIMETKIKIPFGHIGLLQSGKYSVESCDQIGMKAWTRSMSPVIDMSYRAPGLISYEGDIMDKIHHMFNDLRNYVNMEKEYISARLCLFGLKSSVFTSKEVTKSVIERIRYIQAALFSQRLKTERYILSKFLDDSNMKYIASQIYKYGLRSMVDGSLKSADSSIIWDIFTSILLRALVMPGNTRSRLNMIKPMLPFEDGRYESMILNIDKMKEEAKSDSAALARVFDKKFIS